MTRRLLAVLLGITLAVLAALEIPLALSYERQVTNEVATELQRDALTIGDTVEDDLETGDPATLAAVVADYARQRGGRAVLLDADGVGVADSSPSRGAGSAVGRSFAGRPEVAEALAGQSVVLTRSSATEGGQLVVVAVPVRSGTSILGVVRVSRPRADLDAKVARYRAALAVIALVAVAMATGLGLLLARWVTRPVAALQQVAGRLEAGELDERADPTVGPPEVQALSARFNAMAHRVALLVRSSQAFAADASHQLRTPLTALRLQLENLDATGAAPGDVGPLLAEVERLEAIIDGLLALTRLDRATAEPALVELGPFLERRAATWADAAADGEVGLAVAAPAGVSTWFDPNHLEQVVDNLLANALEVAPPGTTVRLEARPGGEGVVEVHVVDRGPGLAEEDRVRAFDRSWSLRADGHGLGLAIVAALCAHNRATARLDPGDDGGIDAVVTVPIASNPRPSTTA